ncbi:uncharacterized protein Bfra_009142 [Botrytis fragariae]|uniref:Uncharacterized protein n=1 Tax=Botrytis fragariae TaxID=1964551 RepID=A0A8H6ARD6_9HELO|nr:uncharacterized protein Bfra_009142 [Botrytis fragariae]KAF5872113.1 hypothetical protein Bfra_009142 [Botrytis fragariae]
MPHQQYDENGKALDPEGHHDFTKIESSVHFDPKTRHDDIKSGGSSSGDGKGKKAQGFYDPVRSIVDTKKTDVPR